MLHMDALCLCRFVTKFLGISERFSGNTQSCDSLQAGTGELRLVMSAVALVVPSRRYGVQRHILLNLSCGLAVLLHGTPCRTNQETYDDRP